MNLHLWRTRGRPVERQIIYNIFLEIFCVLLFLPYKDMKIIMWGARGRPVELVEK